MQRSFKKRSLVGQQTKQKRSFHFQAEEEEEIMDRVRADKTTTVEFILHTIQKGKTPSKTTHTKKEKKKKTTNNRHPATSSSTFIEKRHLVPLEENKTNNKATTTTASASKYLLRHHHPKGGSNSGGTGHNMNPPIPGETAPES